MIDDCENLGKRRVRFARKLLTLKRQTGNCIPRVSLPPRPPAGVNNWMIRPDNSPCANVDRSKTVAVAGCLFVMSVCVDACWAGDWPGWLGPQRNGRSSETIAAWKAEPQTVWKQPVGNGYSSPIAWEGLVFVHSAVKGQDSELVQAFDAVTGKRVWDDTYSRETYRSELGTGPRATPTVHNGRLYTMGITGILSCYDAKTGNRIWRVNPYSELNASRPGFGVCSSPLVVADRVVLPVGGAGSGVVAYHAETGELAWKACDEPAAAASPVMVSRPNAGGEGTRVEVVVQTTLRLLGMNPSDGTIYWEHPLVFQPSGVSPTPLAAGNLLVCSTQDTGTLTLRLPTDATSQPELTWWKQDIASYFSTGTIRPDGVAYIVTNALAPLPKANLQAIDVRTGSLLWEQNGLGYFHLGPILLSDGKLLILDDAGNVVLAEAGREGFKQLAKAKVCGGTFCNPALAGGKVFVRDQTHLSCIDLVQRDQ